MSAASGGNGLPRVGYLQWFRLADHDVDEATRKTVRHRWARHWGTAALHGTLCAVLLAMVHQMLTQIVVSPISGTGGVVTAFGSLLTALSFQGLLLVVVATTTFYGVVWLVETVRGHCSRPIGVVAVGVATAGTALSVIALGCGAPAVHPWISGSLAAARDAASGTAPPLLSAEVTEHIAASLPWLVAATAIAATIWFGPHSGPREGRFKAGRLDYRTVDATAYLPAAVIKQYRNTQRGTSRG